MDGQLNMILLFFSAIIPTYWIPFLQREFRFFNLFIFQDMVMQSTNLCASKSTPNQCMAVKKSIWNELNWNAAVNVVRCTIHIVCLFIFREKINVASDWTAISYWQTEEFVLLSKSWNQIKCYQTVNGLMKTLEHRFRRM